MSRVVYMSSSFWLLAPELRDLSRVSGHYSGLHRRVVESLRGDCRFIPADWGSQQQIRALLLFLKTFYYKDDKKCKSISIFFLKIITFFFTSLNSNPWHKHAKWQPSDLHNSLDTNSKFSPRLLDQLEYKIQIPKKNHISFCFVLFCFVL